MINFIIIIFLKCVLNEKNYDSIEPLAITFGRAIRKEWHSLI